MHVTGALIQLQLSRKSLQLSRLRTIPLKQLSCTFRGPSCTLQLSATQTRWPFKTTEKLAAYYNGPRISPPSPLPPKQNENT